MRFPNRVLLALVASLVLALAGCGDDDAEPTAATSVDDGASASVSEPAAEPAAEVDAASEAVAETDDDRPTVVVTTNILGDVVENLVGDEAEVVVIMPVGADPHDFQASAQQVDQMRRGDALIVNGGGYEEGLVDVIDAAVDDGVPTHEAIGVVDTIEFGAGGHDHDHDDEHADDEHDHGDDEEHDHDDERADDEHDHEGDDPHFFTDPARMAVAAGGIVDFMIDTIDGIDAAALEANAADYVAELEALDAEVAEIVAIVPDDKRLLVTNHDAFGYFADRYGFEILGSIIPGGTTLAGASAQDLAELASVIGELGVPAVFAETTTSSQLAETLASEVGDVAVVDLFSGSLGPPGSEGATYIEMVRTNAERIAQALAG